MTQCDGGATGGPRLCRGNDNVDQLPVDMAASLKDELADQRGGNGRGIEIRSTLETMRGIRVQAVPLAAAADRCRIEPRSLHQNIFCFGGDHRVPAAHYAGEGEGFFLVGHHQVFGIQHTLDSIQRTEFFAATSAAQDDATFQLVAIEDVGGLPHGDGNVVGRVHGIGDELLLQQAEALGDYAGRRLDTHLAESPRGEAAAKLGSFDGNLDRHRQ